MARQLSSGPRSSKMLVHCAWSPQPYPTTSLTHAPDSFISVNFQHRRHVTHVQVRESMFNRRKGRGLAHRAEP